MKRKAVAIVGVGLMGAGIARVFATRGHPVSIFDQDAKTALTAAKQIDAAIPAEGSSAGVRVSAQLADAVADAAFVFECVSEKLEIKRQVFDVLGDCTRPEAVLASNTSVIPITHIAKGLACEARVIGAHWWNPAHLVPLVEVVPGAQTDPRHIEAMIELLISVGKKPVRINCDIPGFVGNRLQFALWREAQNLVAQGVCDAGTVDDIVKSSFGPRLAVLGPLENADLIGLDLTLDIVRVVMPHIDNSREPNPLLASLVAAGRLGFKTGGGFREWSAESMEACRRRLTAHLSAHFSDAREPASK